jgi:hypothetical protein
MNPFAISPEPPLAEQLLLASEWHRYSIKRGRKMDLLKTAAFPV